MSKPIGILDSGVGGLSIVRAIQREMPGADLVYYADTAGFPYGEKGEPEIRELVSAGLRVLRERGCETVVLACNTASTQGLGLYKAEFSDLELIGVTPQLKEATKLTKTGKIIVLATFATLASDYYRALKAQIDPGMQVFAQACFEWVRLVETGEGETGLVADQMRAFARHGIDTAVLACTHFAFLEPMIREAAPDMQVVEPGAAIAAQLKPRAHAGASGGQIEYIITGNRQAFIDRAKQLL